jgi:hypothetical protein
LKAAKAFTALFRRLGKAKALPTCVFGSLAASLHVTKESLPRKRAGERSRMGKLFSCWSQKEAELKK